MRAIQLALTFLIPDRLPSLIVLVDFWIPPALAGWLVAEYLERGIRQYRAITIFVVLAVFVVAYATGWFFFNLGRMPPYIPGATMDPTFASRQAVAALAVVTGAVILPGSALACLIAFRLRRRRPRRVAASSGSA